MRLSGFSFRIGKRSRVYFSKSKKSKTEKSGCGLVAVLLLPGLFFLAGLVIELKSRPINWGAVLFAFAGVFLFLLLPFVIPFVSALIPSKKDRKEKTPERAPEAGNRSCAADGQPLPDKPGKFVFVLEGLEDEEGQRFLHDLKIRRTAEGIRGQFSLQDEDGVFSVLLDGQLLGHPGKADSAWLSENFSRFVGVENLHVYGGGTDRDGQPRPFVVKIWAKLTPGPDGPKLSDVFLKPPLLNGYTCKGDQVVYVSSTGKIHTGNCGAGLSGCTPMLYEEALDQGFVECGNCFR